MILRQYQQQCISQSLDGFKIFSKQLVVAPTGAGKAVMMAKMAQAFLPQRTLILCHREELIQQAAQKLKDATGINADIEKAEHWANRNAPVVVGSVQTLQGERLKRWPTDHFGLIICDEAHHSISASWQNTLRHFDAHAKVWGCTATPDRGDKRNLGAYYENIAFEIGLFDLIHQGYLSRICVKSVPIKIDLNRVRQSAGDYNESDLAETITPYLHEVARAIREEALFRRTLVFVPLCNTSRAFVDACRAEGLTAEHVDGNSPNRKHILERFARCEFDVLSNAMLLTEGFDDPGIDCVVILRPTKSRSLYCLDMETEVLTNNGWKKKISEGDLVAAFDPKTEAICFVPPMAAIERPLYPWESFYSLSGQSVDIRVTGNHRMLHDNKRRTGWKFRSAESLAKLKDTSYLPVAGYTFSEDLPLTDDELRFIGWVMTDGSINKCNGAIYLTQGEHQPWLEQIQECINGCGFKFTRSVRKRKTQFKSNSNAVVWTISKGAPRGRDKHKTGWGRLEPYLSKNFSPLLMKCSRRQFHVLLDAIHLGDGSKQDGQSWERRSYHISTGNRTFAERLQITAILNGWRASIAIQRYNKNPLYVVHLKDQNWIRVGGKSSDRPSWIKEERAIGDRCWCVQNRLGTLVTRRNGKVAIVGNSQMVGRGTRIAPAKSELLLLDLLWLHEKLNLIRPAHLIATSEDQAQAITQMTQEKSSGGQQMLDLEVLVTEEQIKREERLRKALEQKAKRKSKTVDAMEWCLNMGEHDLVDYEPTMKWESEPVTDKQARILKKAGIDLSTVNGKGHASRLITAYFDRKKLQPASDKVKALMKRFGEAHWQTATADEGRRFMAKLHSKRRAA